MRLERDLAAAASAIEQSLAAADLPGVVIGITDRTQLRTSIVHGYADLKARRPLTLNSRMAIGSISKSFAAVAMLQVAAEGRLDLHAPITRYFRGLDLQSPLDTITAHHLLTHTSGLPFYLMHAASSRYVIAALREFVPSFAPGEHWWYSNTGYQLLGYVLEDIERRSYPAIIRHRILNPLRMESTAVVLDDAQRVGMATSYARWPYAEEYLEAPWFEYTASDGGLVSTVPDMCAYARFLLNGGRGLQDRLLSEADFETLTKPVLENYAYGLFVTQTNGRVVVGHEGGIAGFNSVLEVHLHDGFGLVLLCSSSIESSLKKWISETVVAAFRGSILLAAPALRTPLKSTLEDYAGIYRVPIANDILLKRELEFVVSYQRLFVRSGNDLRPLLRMGRDCFRIADVDSGGAPFVFGRECGAVDGRVVEVSHGSQWYTTSQYPSETGAPRSQDYSSYVGHFENSGPEGPAARVFVRAGRLYALMSLGDTAKPIPLEPIADGLFRLGEEPYIPERVQFDTFMDGHALRMTISGVPLYRKDTP